MLLLLLLLLETSSLLLLLLPLLLLETSSVLLLLLPLLLSGAGYDVIVRRCRRFGSQLCWNDHLPPRRRTWNLNIHMPTATAVYSADARSQECSRG